MDIERWKEKYSFLVKVLDLFEEYNDDITDEYEGRFGPCDFLTRFEGENRTKYKHFCMKLVRNIWLMSELTEEDMAQPVRPNRGMTKNERCTNLNKWIFYYLKKVSVPEKIIKEIFRITNNLINKFPHYHHCQYESINNLFIKPQYMVNLSFLGDNFHTISEILGDKSHHHYDACVKYILECAAIYKKINKPNCPKNYDKTQLKLANTCNELQNFKYTYDNELSKVELLSEKLPKLEDELTEAEQIILLEQEQKEQEEYDAAKNGFSSTLQRNITTGAVTAAGTGAILLALNKFTSVGKLFRSRKRTPEVGNILEEGPSEAPFLNDPDYMHMNSDTTSYNVGYGSAENY